MEKISVVVITYNEEDNINNCLNSLINLDYDRKNYEILVVDSSNDNTKSIVKEFKQVRLISSENKGYGIQRNLGIKNSKYNLIAFTDADCIVPKSWLKDLISEVKDYDCLGGRIKDPEGTKLIE